MRHGLANFRGKIHNKTWGATRIKTAVWQMTEMEKEKVLATARNAAHKMLYYVLIQDDINMESGIVVGRWHFRPYSWAGGAINRPADLSRFEPIEVEILISVSDAAKGGYHIRREDDGRISFRMAQAVLDEAEKTAWTAAQAYFEAAGFIPAEKVFVGDECIYREGITTVSEETYLESVRRRLGR